MIAVDTNLMVWAHRRDSPWHEGAREAIRELAEGIDPWAIPWPCIHEFLAITTHPRIYDPPSSVAAALDQIEAWSEAPGLALLAESRGYREHLGRLVRSGEAVGGRVHDARIAALCLHHGVSELWSADRDFGRFPQLKVRNPLVDG